jgi:hypothetical protein
MEGEILWDKIANERIFPGFRELFCYHYYLHRKSLDYVVALLQASQTGVTREILVAKCRIEDLPLRKSDEGG